MNFNIAEKVWQGTIFPKLTTPPNKIKPINQTKQTKPQKAKNKSRLENKSKCLILKVLNKSKATENLLHPYVLGFFQSRWDKNQDTLYNLKKKNPNHPRKKMMDVLFYVAKEGRLKMSLCLFLAENYEMWVNRKFTRKLVFVRC